MRKMKEINQLLAGGFISVIFHRAKPVSEPEASVRCEESSARKGEARERAGGERALRRKQCGLRMSCERQGYQGEGSKERWSYRRL